MSEAKHTPGPCAVCCRAADAMLGDEYCLGCQRDDLLAACKAARVQVAHPSVIGRGTVLMNLDDAIAKAEITG